jgi:hypothetical protein
MLPPANGDQSGPPEETRRKLTCADNAGITKHDTLRIKLDKCIDVFIQIYEQYGFNRWCVTKVGSKKEYDPSPTLNHYIKLGSEIGGRKAWLDLIKYKVIANFNFWNLESLPTKKFVSEDCASVILGGRAQRWAMLLKQQNPNLFFSLTSSIRYAGTGCPRPDEDMLEEECLKTVEDLTTPSDDVENEILVYWDDEGDLPRESCTITEENCKWQLTRTVRETTRRAPKLARDSCLSPYFPSTKASNVKSIREGGTLASVLELIQDIRANLKIEGSGVIFRNESVEAYFPLPNLTFEKVRELGGDEKLDSYINDWMARMEENLEGPHGVIPNLNSLGVVADLSELERGFREAYRASLKHALGELPIAVPVALAEPLKIRVITKMAPHTQFVLKRFQGWMWQALQQKRIFKLTSTPVTADIINEYLKDLRNEEELWNSGDYVASTNNLKSWVSETCVDALTPIMGLNQEEVNLFKRSLTGNLFIVKTQEEGDLLVKQRTGQLMGSVVSFPILCLANAAICRWAMEISEGHRLSLAECRLLVNGDDCVFPCNRRGYNAFKKIAKAFGLSLSPGKSYWNKNFLQINSEEFRKDESGLYQAVPKLNIGLLYGQGKTGRGGGVHAFNIGDHFNEYIQKCPVEIRTQAAIHFLRFPENKRVLESCKVPWFMPKWLGGLGLNPISESSRSLKDRRRAKAILMNIGSLKPIAALPDLSWKIHRKIEDTIPDNTTTYSLVHTPYGTQSLESNYHRLYSALAVSHLWTSSLKDLYRPSEKSMVEKALKHNQKIWLWALNHCAGDEGLDDWALEPRKFTHYPLVQLSTPKYLTDWFLAEPAEQAERLIQQWEESIRRTVENL